MEDTESPDNLIVQQRMLIQHLVEKTRGMTEKITRMERVIHQLDANHQENVKMLDVAKVHICGIYTHTRNCSTYYL